MLLLLCTFYCTYWVISILILFINFTFVGFSLLAFVQMYFNMIGLSLKLKRTLQLLKMIMLVRNSVQYISTSHLISLLYFMILIRFSLFSCPFYYFYFFLLHWKQPGNIHIHLLFKVKSYIKTFLFTFMDSKKEEEHKIRNTSESGTWNWWKTSEVGWMDNLQVQNDTDILYYYMYWDLLCGL